MKSRLATAIVFFGSLLIVIRGTRNYAPLTEGWWHVYVNWINQGKIPYRDFELLVPPGYPYLLRLTTLLVGEGFLALRVVGAIQFAVIGVCVYLLIRRFAPNFISGAHCNFFRGVLVFRHCFHFLRLCLYSPPIYVGGFL